MNKKYKWSVALVALTLLLAACAGEGEGTTTTGGDDGGDTTTTAGDGGATSTTAGGAAGETPYAELNQALAGEFEGTTVEIVAQWAPDGAEAESFDAHPAAVP